MSETTLPVRSSPAERETVKRSTIVISVGKLSRLLSALVLRIDGCVSDVRDGGTFVCEDVLPLHNESSARLNKLVKTEGLWTLSLWFIEFPVFKSSKAYSGAA